MVLMPVEQDFSTFFAKFFDWFLVLSQISDSGIYVSTSIEYKFLANIHFSKNFHFQMWNHFLKATLLLKMIMVGDQVNEVKKH